MYIYLQVNLYIFPSVTHSLFTRLIICANLVSYMGALFYQNRSSIDGAHGEWHSSSLCVAFTGSTAIDVQLSPGESSAVLFVIPCTEVAHQCVCVCVYIYVHVYIAIGIYQTYKLPIIVNTMQMSASTFVNVMDLYYCENITAMYIVADILKIWVL